MPHLLERIQNLWRDDFERQTQVESEAKQAGRDEIIQELTVDLASQAQALTASSRPAALWAAAHRHPGVAHPLCACLFPGPFAALQRALQTVEACRARRSAVLYSRQNRANQPGMRYHH